MVFSGVLSIDARLHLINVPVLPRALSESVVAKECWLLQLARLCGAFLFMTSDQI